MSMCHLHVKTHKRGDGSGAYGHFQYILRIGSFATKKVEVKEGSLMKIETVSRANELAYSYSNHLPSWSDEAAFFWQAADQFERSNGTVYREVEFSLPVELPDFANFKLARDYAELLAHVAEGFTPYTLAVHRSINNPSQLHCHLMLSDKVLDDINRNCRLWFKRAANPGKDPSFAGARKTQSRFSTSWLANTVRPTWAELANSVLQEYGINERIDHRRLEIQRQEQEELANEALRRGDEAAARRHLNNAILLNREPQPKRGRVLTHAGSSKASRQAEVWNLYVDREKRRVAELKKREAFENEILESEQNAWPKQPQNQSPSCSETIKNTISFGGACLECEKNRLHFLTPAYKQLIRHALGRSVKVYRVLNQLIIRSQHLEITDDGDRLYAGHDENEQVLHMMLLLARNKGWNILRITGSPKFKLRTPLRARARSWRAPGFHSGSSACAP